MRGLYDKYSSLGFDIYQVSIDPDEHYWKTACEHLPWTCVYESRGEASGYLGSYLVRRLPTYFLINRHGDLVARDEQIDDLEKQSDYYVNKRRFTLYLLLGIFRGRHTILFLETTPEMSQIIETAGIGSFRHVQSLFCQQT